MPKEKTFAIIKPDGMKHKPEIMKRIGKAGLKIVRSNMTRFEASKAAQFYIHVRDKNELIYQSLVNYMTSGEIIPMILEGENAVQVLRILTGHTDPEKAEKGTIRKDLGTDKKSVADAEMRAVKNLIHSSGSVEEAEKEMKFFF